MDKLEVAIFPVGGVGTRFLPATKNMPKEMMPLLNRPLIQWGVEEAVNSGCTNVIIVTGEGKEAIKAHFSRSFELEAFLTAHDKEKYREIVSSIPALARFSFAKQPQPLGLGHAVLCAERLCKERPFALLLPDDVMLADKPVTAQLEAVRQRYGGSAIALQKVSDEDTQRYGVVDAEEIEPGVYKIKSLVEKPKAGTAPSNLAVMGRYVLSPAIFRYLRSLQLGAGGEYQLTDAINAMLAEEPAYGVIYEGKRLDCGITEGWLKANLQLALHDPEMRKAAIEVLKEENII